MDAFSSLCEENYDRLRTAVLQNEWREHEIAMRRRPPSVWYSCIFSCGGNKERGHAEGCLILELKEELT